MYILLFQTFLLRLDHLVYLQKYQIIIQKKKLGKIKNPQKVKKEKRQSRKINQKLNKNNICNAGTQTNAVKYAKTKILQ